MAILNTSAEATSSVTTSRRQASLLDIGGVMCYIRNMFYYIKIWCYYLLKFAKCGLEFCLQNGQQISSNCHIKLDSARQWTESMIKKIATSGNLLLNYSPRTQVDGRLACLKLLIKMQKYSPKISQKKSKTGVDTMDSFPLRKLLILLNSLLKACSKNRHFNAKVSTLKKEHCFTQQALPAHAVGTSNQRISIAERFAPLLPAERLENTGKLANHECKQSAMDSSLVKRFARLLSVQVIEIIEKIVKHECEESASYWSQYANFGTIIKTASQSRESLIKKMYLLGNYSPRTQVTVQTSLASDKKLTIMGYKRQI